MTTSLHGRKPGVGFRLVQAFAGVLCVPAILVAAPVLAQPGGYYAGKTVKMIIGLGAGGGYDLWARTVARHIGKHLPGTPTVISQNMEGAGSFRAASYMANQAPRDGTVMALIARDAALGPITGNPGAQFDPTRFSWLGTTTTETNVCVSYKTAAVKSVRDLYRKELMVGDNGAGTGTGNYPKALNQLLGFKFKIIRGYASSVDVVLAMERGEVEGYCESLESVFSKRPDWIPNKIVNVLFQGGVKPNPTIKDVPFVNDLASNENDRKAIEFLYAGQGIGRPFFAPPGLAPEVHAMMKQAFKETMKDPDFIAEVKQKKMTLEPEDGDYMQALIERIYATPKPIVERIGSLLK